MRIQIGQIILDRVTKQRIPYNNKTSKYLLPCIKIYGKEFENKINDVFKVAVGIGDIVVSNRGYKHEKHLFLMVDSAVCTPFFHDFMQYIKEHDSYEKEYVYGNIRKSSYHIVIIKFPVQFYDAFETFKMGDYSRMFKKTEIDTYFGNHPLERRVLLKDEAYRFKFAFRTNKLFGTSIPPGDFKELDEAPRDQEEIFNDHLAKKQKEEKDEGMVGATEHT